MKIAFHVGFVKTATTTMQKVVFPALRGVNYLGIPASDPELDAAICGLCQTDGIKWSAEQTADIFSRPLGSDRLNLVSYENYALYESKDKTTVAARIKTLFPEAKIIFTIRRQSDLVESWYFQKLGVRMTSYKSLKRWIDDLPENKSFTIFDDINFDDCIRHYESVFGSGNIGVFLFEELRASPAAFAKKLAAFLELGREDEETIASLLTENNRNPRLTARHIALAKFATYIAPGILYRGFGRIMPAPVKDMFENWLARGGTPRATLTEGHKKLIHDMCAQGNRALAERHGLDLEKYGYPL